MANSLSAMADEGAQGTPPATAPAPAAAAGAPAAPQKQIHINEVKGIIAKQAEIDRALRGLLKEPGPVARKKVIDMAVGLVANQVMSAQAMAGYLADLPEDPQAIRQWAAGHAQTVEKGLDQLMGMVHGVGFAEPPTQNSGPAPNSVGGTLQ